MPMKRKKIEMLSRIMNVMKVNCQFKDKRIAAKMGITSSELNCLKQYVDDKALSVKVLAERMNISPGGVTRIVSSLEEAGVLSREMDPLDRRGIHVRLTAKGAGKVEELCGFSIQCFSHMLEKVPSAKLDLILEGLTLLNDVWGEGMKNIDKMDTHLQGSDNC
jgi:DNA-binding MarR family transcriptional regulator